MIRAFIHTNMYVIFSKFNKTENKFQNNERIEPYNDTAAFDDASR